MSVPARPEHAAAGPASRPRPRRADPETVAQILRRLADIGPYFAVTVPATADLTGPAGPQTTGTGMHAALDLYRPGRPLAAAIDALGERMGTRETRVAASTLFLGYAARLWSISLGALITGAVVPDLLASNLRLAAPAGEPLTLILDRTGGWLDDPDSEPAERAALLATSVIDGHLTPLVDAVHAQTRTAVGLLWSNAASALLGAVRVLQGHQRARRSDPSAAVPSAAGPSAAGPDAAGPGAGSGLTELAVHLLRLPPLAGTTTYTTTETGGLHLDSAVRTSCCLFYRVPGGGTCGDCPLTDRPAAAAHYGQHGRASTTTTRAPSARPPARRRETR